MFFLTTEQDKKNAARLALCWNTCEHLSDEELSEGVVSVKKLRSYLIGLYQGGHVALAEKAFLKLTGKPLEPQQ